MIISFKPSLELRILSKKTFSFSQTLLIVEAFSFRRESVATCFALMTLMWWTQQCMATLRGSSTTPVNPTATLE